MEASVVFDQKLYAYSGSFALMYLDVSVSSAFQSGNKVRQRLLGARGGRVADSHTASCHQAYLPEKVLTFFQSQSGRDNPGWLTHAGMVFEVTNHLRMPAYCGVREFVCPEDDMIILPDWVHKSLFLEEGIAVRVRSVALPKLAFLRVQVRCVQGLPRLWSRTPALTTLCDLLVHRDSRIKTGSWSRTRRGWMRRRSSRLPWRTTCRWRWVTRWCSRPARAP